MKITYLNSFPILLAIKLERSVYNRRKRKLSHSINDMRLKLAQKFNEFEDSFIVDSMPLEICKIARIGRSKICKEQEYSYPNRGFCASQQMPFYGYKLHAVCSRCGIFQSVDLSPASVHDSLSFCNISCQLSN